VLDGQWQLPVFVRVSSLFDIPSPRSKGGKVLDSIVVRDQPVLLLGGQRKWGLED